MEIERLVTGYFQTNTYLLSVDHKYLIIDPSGKAEKIASKIDGEVLAIILTHGHFDHIKAVDDLYEMYHCDIYLNENDKELVDPVTSKSCNGMLGITASIKSPIKNIKEGHKQIAPFEFDVYETPGHTMGSVIYVFEDAMFTGDTLFKGSVGRTDLYGGNSSTLKQSLKLFRTFNKDYDVYPGHDAFTTLDKEIATNPYI